MASVVRRGREPLAIREQSYFWLGVSRSARGGETRTTGEQMYVGYQIPAEVTQPCPVVLVHGGGGQGLDYLGTPDGRRGWATRFLEAGYAVYVVDRPGLGRSPFSPDQLGSPGVPPTFEMIQRIGAAEGPGHTQWPGPWAVEGQELGSFVAGMGPSISDMGRAHSVWRERGAELLDRIGPAILLTHSAGGPFGWVTADARPGLVQGVVAVEPAGPAFAPGPDGRAGLEWGLTASPLEFDPPVTDPSQLGKAEVTHGGSTYTLQASPARRLPALRRIPTAVVIAEHSPARATRAPGVAAFLRQAGCPAEEIRLWEHGVRGNGHFMMAERNSDEVLQVIFDWIDANVTP